MPATAEIPTAEEAPKKRPRSGQRKVFRVTLDPDSGNKLCREAERRRISPSVLMGRISKVVVNDDLVDAVLDDDDDDQ